MLSTRAMPFLFVSFLAAVLSLVLYSLPSPAQTIPNQSLPERIVPNQQPLLQPEQQPEKGAVFQSGDLEEESLEVPEAPLVTGVQATGFKVEQFKVSGFKQLSQAELDGVTQSYRGKVATLEDLQDLLRDINKLYKDKGLLTSFAYLPEQDVNDGTIELKALEGTIGEITLKGFDAYSAEHIANQIESNPGDLFNVKAFEKNLASINQGNPYQLKATLSAGQQTGQTDINLDVYEPNRWQVTAFTDNLGRPFIGQYRWGLEVVNKSLLGNTDQLYLQYTGTTDTHAAAINYQYPLNDRGTTLGAVFGFSYVDIDLEQTNQAELEGGSYTYGLNLIQPLNKERTVNIDGGFNFIRSSSFTNRAQTRRDDVLALINGLNVQKIDRYGQTFARFQQSVGVDTVGGDDAFWRGQGFLTRWVRLPKKHLLLIRATGQLSHGPLPTSQQFQLGGEYSTRGYTQGLLIGDRGYSLNVEHQWPLPYAKKWAPDWAQDVRGLFFFDIGQTWIDNDSVNFVPGLSNTRNRSLLMSAGVGFRYRLTQYFEGFTDLGFPLLNRAAIEPNSMPSIRVHFGLRSSLLPEALKVRSKKVFKLSEH